MASYNAIVSAVLHFESYRNIDLPHQGLYFLRATLSAEDETAVAVPLDLRTSPFVCRPKEGKIDYHNVLPATVQGKEFCSKTFTIRYCEEEVELNDICEFRLEIPITRNNLEASLAVNYVLNIELHFGCLIGIGGAEKLVSHMSNIKNTIAFEVISVQKFVVRNIAKSITQYIAVQTDKNYYGTANATLHTTLLDFRYRTVPLEPFFVKPSAAAGNDKTLCDFLFGSGSEVQTNEADRIYSEYVNQLAESYNCVKKKFIETQVRCLDEKERKENFELLKCQDLVLPGEVQDRAKECSIDWNDSFDVEIRQESSKTQDDENECNITSELYRHNNSKPISFLSEERKVNASHGSKLKCSLRMLTKDTRKCAAKFALNISLIAGQVVELWQRYIELVTMAPRFVTEMLRLEYLESITMKK
eukprot:TRINITY_DN11612_c0_g2_i4.p1 TRINITY_DN11612_c0_g2~~TRINITY_DN11612_c0_g2_i4.p1  ORF type:complete len:417 (+),score=88.84 TRINITY_DN11612_c0_g2_i4:115-1365(+)